MDINRLEELGFVILAKGDTYFVANNKTSLPYWFEIGYDIEKSEALVMGAYLHKKGGTVRLKLYSGECKDTDSLKAILKSVEHY